MKKPSLVLLFLLISCIAFACRPSLHANEIMELARSTENNVEVIISMQRDADDHITLLATFTPQEPSLHLYSKDIPKTGIDGLGRPTLLEISRDSAFQALGELRESIPAQLPNSAPLELLVYPAGPVTLSLPVQTGNANTTTVFVTYMACDQRGCRAPVQNKAIEINIPKQ